MNTWQWSFSWPWPLNFIHHTSSHASGPGTLSCFKFCISKHRLYSCAWNCWTPNLGSCIGVSCNLVAISNAFAWVESFCSDNTVLRCGVKDATNHVQCYTSISVILASWIILFSHWFKSHGVSPRSIMISLKPMIDCISDFRQLNSLFSAFWISVIPAFGWSFECLIYHVSLWSCNELTNVAFLMLSSMTPCASHTTLTMNQNWSRSSFPTPMNMGSLIALATMNYGFGGGGWLKVEVK